jgi:predicted RNA-binding protein with PIN domain
MSDERLDPVLGQLPDPVRLRILALTAEVLPDLVRLPPALRRVAAFAPGRRARLGATAIATALETDDDLRERVAKQVTVKGARVDSLIAAPTEGGIVDAGERAALAWLVRPEGWQDVLAAALPEASVGPTTGDREDSRVARLQAKLDEAEQAVRELRAQHRVQVDEYKSENTSLRRKLGESRAAERAARAATEERSTELEQALGEARASLAAQEKELRRLRTQVAQLEAGATADRRAARSDRDEVTLRARILLDTVIDAASGLRRELALPAVAGAPGDRIEAELAGDQARAAAPPTPGTDSPWVIEQQLSMPRARLIVDGYNVSKTAWPSSSLEAQRTRLLGALAPLVARTGAETTVVFDAAAASARPVVNTPRGVKVVFSPVGVIADDVIRDLVAAEPPGRVVVVVTDDRAVVSDVVTAGARVASCGSLLSLVSGGR